ncbi:hypothetical protein J3R83DRAFT_7897 [Lanmaoa asiatica]|nr:hypothetical protein J3R83DRAFT_7896 [Lanmaoa asiatica]KAH0836344.1 hypothetical protein J3R83DRAFT_7897 [Lanmaoa asiatica]
MRISSSLVSFVLCLGFTAAAVVPNVGDISARDNAVSEGTMSDTINIRLAKVNDGTKGRLSRRLTEDTGKNLAGVVETIKRGGDDGLGDVLEQLLKDLGTVVDDLLAGDHL